MAQSAQFWYDDVNGNRSGFILYRENVGFIEGLSLTQTSFQLTIFHKNLPITSHTYLLKIDPSLSRDKEDAAQVIVNEIEDFLNERDENYEEVYMS